MPKNITARPTTDFARENIFNVLENMLDFDGLRALDLFAGTGAVSIELLSRGCGSVTAVEKSNIQYNFIRKVAQELGEKNLTLVKGDVFKFVAVRNSTSSSPIRHTTCLDLARSQGWCSTLACCTQVRCSLLSIRATTTSLRCRISAATGSMAA